MQFECSLIDPFGMNRKLDRFPDGFKDIDSDTTDFLSRWGIHAEQLHGIVEILFPQIVANATS